MVKDQSKPVLTAKEILKKHTHVNDDGTSGYYDADVIRAMEEYHSQFEKQRGGLYEEKVYSLIVNLAKEISSFDFLTDDEILLIKKVTKSICQLSLKSIDEEQLTQLADKWVIAYESKEQELEFKEEFKNDVRQLSLKEDALRKEVEELKAELENERHKRSVCQSAYEELKSHTLTADRKEVGELKAELQIANEMIFAQRLDHKADVPFRVAYLRDLEKQVSEEKISYSRMIELMNEKAKYFYKSQTFTAEQIAEALPSDEEIEKEAEMRYGEKLGGGYHVARPIDKARFIKGTNWMRQQCIERLSGMMPKPVDEFKFIEWIIGNDWKITSIHVWTKTTWKNISGTNRTQEQKSTSELYALYCEKSGMIPAKEESKDIIALEKERLEWSLNTFTKATAISSLEKLSEEMEEVANELNHGHPGEDLYEEYADCLMCLFDSAGRAGVSINDLFEAFERKLKKNKERKWVKNDNNTYSHVKPSAPQS